MLAAHLQLNENVCVNKESRAATVLPAVKAAIDPSVSTSFQSLLTNTKLQGSIIVSD